MNRLSAFLRAQRGEEPGRSFARRLGISSVTLFRLEQGLTEQPGPSVLEAIAEGTGTSVEQVALLVGQAPQDVLEWLQDEEEALLAVRCLMRLSPPDLSDVIHNARMKGVFA